MNARDELAEILHRRIGGSVGETVGDILAAGYRKPRIITTVAEMDALPKGSVILTAGVEDECDPRVAVKDGTWHNESEWHVADDSEWLLSSDELDDLPATVLYEPEPQP